MLPTAVKHVPRTEPWVSRHKPGHFPRNEPALVRTEIYLFNKLRAKAGTQKNAVLLVWRQSQDLH